jgi:hypothetical protein
MGFLTLYLIGAFDVMYCDCATTTVTSTCVEAAGQQLAQHHR